MDRYLAERSALLDDRRAGASTRRGASLRSPTGARRAWPTRPEPPAGPLVRRSRSAATARARCCRPPTSTCSYSPRAPRRPLRPFVESLLYPLWDAGLEVGHQVRSPRITSRAARDDLTVLTATLTARAIAGDTPTGLRPSSAARRRSRPRTHARLRARSHSGPRPGSPYLLEPDLKEGAGGRRDYDELALARCAGLERARTRPASAGGGGRPRPRTSATCWSSPPSSWRRPAGSSALARQRTATDPRGGGVDHDAGPARAGRPRRHRTRPRTGAHDAWTLPVRPTLPARR